MTRTGKMLILKDDSELHLRNLVLEHSSQLNSKFMYSDDIFVRKPFSSLCYQSWENSVRMKRFSHTDVITR